jgi:hypothetical protein
MSQSDYLRRKRVANVLKLDAAEQPIMESSRLRDFKQFQLENEITSTNIRYHRIVPTNKQLVLNIEKDVSNCPTFIVCTGTSQRPNRVPHQGRLCNDLPLTWHERNDAINAKQLDCKCELNRSTTDANRCACVTGR